MQVLYITQSIYLRMLNFQLLRYESDMVTSDEAMYNIYIKQLRLHRSYSYCMYTHARARANLLNWLWVFEDNDSREITSATLSGNMFRNNQLSSSIRFDIRYFYLFKIFYATVNQQILHIIWQHYESVPNTILKYLTKKSRFTIITATHSRCFDIFFFITWLFNNFQIFFIEILEC